MRAILHRINMKPFLHYWWQSIIETSGCQAVETGDIMNMVDSKRVLSSDDASGEERSWAKEETEAIWNRRHNFNPKEYSHNDIQL